MMTAITLSLLPLAWLTAAARAQGPDSILTTERYLTPPPAIAEAVLAPRYGNVTLSNPSPDGRYFLEVESEGLPSLATFARPHYYLGGLQVDPRANRTRSLTTRSAAGFDLIAWENRRTVEVQVPAGATASNPQWSPDGARLAFFVHFDDATYLYVADAATGRSRRLARTPVLATFYQGVEWTADGRTLVAVLVPDGRGPEPPEATVPTSPKVRHTKEGKNRLRTYPSLLETPRDMALLEYYTTGQLAAIDANRGSVRKIGAPAMIRGVDLAPDGRYLRVTTMRKPFSYIVPVNSFATAEDVWDLDGQVLATLSERSVREGLPGDTADPDGEEPARRSVTWRPDGQGLSYLQQAPAPPGEGADTAAAEPGEGAERPRRKDRVMQWLPPFDSAGPRLVYESDRRLTGVRYSDDAQVLFLTERQGQTTHVYAVFLSDPSKKHTLTRHRADDFYKNPGDLMTRRGARGITVVRRSPDGEHVFLEGTRYHESSREQGPQSFIDKVAIRTGEKTRVYESGNDGVYERVLAVMDDDVTRLIVSRESPNQVPDSYLRELGTSRLDKLTDNQDHTPDLTRAPRRRIEAVRADGFKFVVNVTLPADWSPGTRLPAIFWFYPREYDDQEAYDESQRTYNKNRFPSLGTRSMTILTRVGYAVVEPDAPITGEDNRPNDNYVHDLRNNLAAVIDALDREGIIDRERIGIGGHSYGAFGAVNAMVHTPFFKAGIAGDGAYNRTLTPLGFQSERRNLWDARETYLGMSPFMYANNLTGALLMYHGLADQNVGTFPINSERLFHALEGLGKTAALYMYPYEDHGPATQETLLDLWARWVAWLDKYVKNAGKEAKPPAVSSKDAYLR